MNTTYTSYRIETYKTGEGKKRFSYDARTSEGLDKARALANKKFSEGYKVTFYRLDKVVDDNGDFEWIVADKKVADGRPQETKTTSKSKSKKESKKETKKDSKKAPKKDSKKSNKEVAQPVALSDDDRLVRLEKQVSDLTTAMMTLIQNLANK